MNIQLEVNGGTDKGELELIPFTINSNSNFMYYKSMSDNELLKRYAEQSQKIHSELSVLHNQGISDQRQFRQSIFESQ